MKKIIIITAILFFAVSGHAQKTTRERTRQMPEKQKSETAVRRSAEQKNHSRAYQSPATKQVHRSRQAPARDISHANRTHTGPAKSQPGDRTATTRSRTDKSTYEKPAEGHIRGTSTAKGRKPGDKSPKIDHNGRFSGQGYKGNTSTKTQRYNHSVRGNSGSRQHANRTPAEHRKHYVTPNRRVVRTNHARAYQYHYNPVKYRNVHYHYHAPKRVHVVWTNHMYREYRMLYPEYRYWYYPIGYEIATIPFYRAYYHIGEVRNIYGRVHEVYYSWATDEYHLYFGGSYPYHDFTVIISGRHARHFDRYPELFFEGRYMWVTGLLSTFEGRPELIVKRRHQIHLY